MVNRDASCLQKQAYNTRQDAESAYQTFRAKMPRNGGRRIKKVKHEQYPHKCQHCGKWHLTRK
jgi:hypothetical protein